MVNKLFKEVRVYEGSNNIVLRDKLGNDEVTLKWDGCIDYRTGLNDIGDNEQYIHLCDIDRAIAKLQELKEIGKKHHQNEYWL